MKMRKIFLVLTVIIFVNGCATRAHFGSSENQVAQLWPSPPLGEDFSYPERYLLGNNWENRFKYGIAFSGGGTRAATATLGQLRAITELGMHDKIGYVSAISGGSWAVVPYIYLPKKFSNERFLGQYQQPEDISKELLDCKGTFIQEEGELYRTCKEVGSLAYAISSSKITRKTITQYLSLSRDESYSRAVGKIFLSPMEIEPIKKAFSWDKHSRKKILDRNKGVLEESDIIITEHPGRPYPIVGATLIASHNAKTQSLYPFEVTPHYAGTRISAVVEGPFKQKKIAELECIETRQRMGGGYVESFAYDSHSMKNIGTSDEGYPLVAIEKKGNRKWFSLSDVIGASGAAPQQTILGIGLDDLGFPEFRHWPINELGRVDAEVCERELSHGDGGHVDNLGIMPLLARRVENIIAFVNTATPFKPIDDKLRNGAIISEAMSDDIISLFRVVDSRPFNVVIDKGSKRLKELYSAFESDLNSGAPLVHCAKYDVIDNDTYGIYSRDYKPQICWVYLNKSKKWEDRANNNSELKFLLLKEQDFKNFPHYKTFFDRKRKIIDLSRQQVHVMSHFSAWSVIESCEYLSMSMPGLVDKAKCHDVSSIQRKRAEAD